MSKRKTISASTRWSVFARDGFSCRYCGANAGEEGVDLVVDHVLSVADGGDDRIDNLATACRRCNGGKGARSLKSAPTAQEVVDRISKQTSTLKKQLLAMRKLSKAKQEVEQEIVNMKCEAYEVETIRLSHKETLFASNLIQEFGVDKLREWYELAACRFVYSDDAIQYVCGIARNVRKEAAEGCCR